MAWTKGTLFSRKACKQSEREDASKLRTRVNVSQRDRGSNMHLPPSDGKCIHTHTHINIEQWCPLMISITSLQAQAVSI